eukprot:1639899-Amphidinium_carterae.1
MGINEEVGTALEEAMNSTLSHLPADVRRLWTSPRVEHTSKNGLQVSWGVRVPAPLLSLFSRTVHHVIEHLSMGILVEDHMSMSEFHP